MTEISNFDKDPEEIKSQADQARKESRRGVLVKAGLGVAAAAGGFLGVERLLRKKSEVEKQDEAEQEAKVEIVEDQKIYENGESVKTPLGEMSLDGWKITLPEIDYLRENASLAFNAFVQGGPNTHQVYIRDRIHGTMEFYPMFDTLNKEKSEEDGASSSTFKYEKDYNNNYGIYAVPDLRTGIITVKMRFFSEKREGASLEEEIFSGGKKKSQQVTLPTKVYYFKFKANIRSVKPEGAEDSHRVFSEMTLPNGQMQAVHDMHRLFSEYRSDKQPLPPVLIFGFPKKDGAPENAGPDAYFNRLAEFAHVSTDHFTDPKETNEAETAVSHELAHAILSYARMQGEEFEKFKDLDEAHFQILKKYGERLVDQPFMQIFREAMHINSKDQKAGSQAGHPWDNENELFASVVTTFRYFPREFLKKYSEMKSGDQEIAKAFAEKCMKFLESMNSDKQTMKKLIPDIDLLRETLGIK